MDCASLMSWLEIIHWEAIGMRPKSTRDFLREEPGDGDPKPNRKRKREREQQTVYHLGNDLTRYKSHDVSSTYVFFYPASSILIFEVFSLLFSLIT